MSPRQRRRVPIPIVPPLLRIRTDLVWRGRPSLGGGALGSVKSDVTRLFRSDESRYRSMRRRRRRCCSCSVAFDGVAHHPGRSGRETRYIRCDSGGVQGGGCRCSSSSGDGLGSLQLRIVDRLLPLKDDVIQGLLSIILFRLLSPFRLIAIPRSVIDTITTGGSSSAGRSRASDVLLLGSNRRRLLGDGRTVVVADAGIVSSGVVRKRIFGTFLRGNLRLASVGGVIIERFSIDDIRIVAALLLLLLRGSASL